MYFCNVYFADAAIFKQFERYLAQKNLKAEELRSEDLRREGVQFMRQAYPGAKSTPNELVTGLIFVWYIKTVQKIFLLFSREGETYDVCRCGSEFAGIVLA